MDLTQQRCFNHLDREAAARCPECQRFFCRECVTEHDDRVICAGCLRQLAKPEKRTHPRMVNAALAGHCILAFMLLWLIIYAVGQLLLLLPSSFHEGTLWRDLPWTEW